MYNSLRFAFLTSLVAVFATPGVVIHAQTPRQAIPQTRAEAAGTYAFSRSEWLPKSERHVLATNDPHQFTRGDTDYITFKADGTLTLEKSHSEMQLPLSSRRFSRYTQTGSGTWTLSSGVIKATITSKKRVNFGREFTRNSEQTFEFSGSRNYLKTTPHYKSPHLLTYVRVISDAEILTRLPAEREDIVKKLTGTWKRSVLKRSTSERTFTSKPIKLRVTFNRDGTYSASSEEKTLTGTDFIKEKGTWRVEGNAVLVQAKQTTTSVSKSQTSGDLITKLKTKVVEKETDVEHKYHFASDYLVDHTNVLYR